MTNISKNRVTRRIARTIDQQFIKTVAALDKKSAEHFFTGFFTAAERVMFAKRLAILLLLQENFSPYYIARLLKVSTSTVRRTSAQAVLTHTTAHKMRLTENSFFKEFREFLFEGLSMSPKRRMKWLNEFEKRYGKA